MNAPFETPQSPRVEADRQAAPPDAAPGTDADLEAILALDGKSRRRRPWRWLIYTVLLVLAGFGAVYWFGYGSTATVSYVTQPVTRGSLTVIVTATGSVEPTNQVDVSSELSGTVRSVLVDYNSRVAVGDLLAELDTDKLKATLDSSRAKVLAAKAKIRDAEATVVETKAALERKKALVAKNFASINDTEAAQAAYDRAVASVDSARADLGVAEADLELNETNFSKARLVSPINGIVLTRSVEPGQTVASSLQAPVLFSIAEDLTQMELQVDVDEADVGKVKVDQTATFTVDAFPDRAFPATIQELRFASEIIQGVVTYKAILTVDNSELLLRPGMTATAEISVEHVDDALLIPNGALRYTPPATEEADTRSLLRRILPGPPRFRRPSAPTVDGANRTVWVLRNNEPAAVDITVGASDGKVTVVTSGDLEQGASVVLDQTTGSK
jgi:HlyD family secretion protein